MRSRVFESVSHFYRHAKSAEIMTKKISQKLHYKRMRKILTFRNDNKVLYSKNRDQKIATKLDEIINEYCDR